MSAALGSMAPETSCKARFTWHYPGSPAYNLLLSSEPRVAVACEIERGYSRIQSRVRGTSDITSGDQSIKKHEFLNYRQYVGERANS